MVFRVNSRVLALALGKGGRSIEGGGIGTTVHTADIILFFNPLMSCSPSKFVASRISETTVKYIRKPCRLRHDYARKK